jgi:hypothetical protein
MTAFLGCRHLAIATAPKPVHFKSVFDFKEFADTGGLHYHSGASTGQLVFPADNFYVADRVISKDDLEGVCTRRDCGLTPAWRGILWVCQIDATHVGTTHPESLGGKWRIWGNVVAAGDEELMDRIEAMYRIK